MMKALAKLKAEPGIWQTEVEMPKVGPNDVLIKIKKTAICGTDVHIYKWDEWAQKTIPHGMVVGHEYVGEVVDMGSEVRGFTKGDRVSGEGHLVCGFCRNCRAGRVHLCRNTIGVGVNREGSFAEYLSIPAFNVFKIPDNIPDNIAAIFDPFGNAVHTALSFDLVGEDVLITGAGPFGIMAAAVCRHVGARHVVITDVNMPVVNGYELAQQLRARGAMLPIVSYLAPCAAALLTGSAVVETIFTIPGVGRYFVLGALNRDYPLVMGTVILVAVFVIVFNLLVDIAYGLLDPRVRND